MTDQSPVSPVTDEQLTETMGRRLHELRNDADLETAKDADGYAAVVARCRAAGYREAFDTVYDSGIAAALRAARTRQAAVDEVCDAIEDEYASRCCNRGPSQPCTDECRRTANVLDRIRAAAAAVPTEGNPDGT